MSLIQLRDYQEDGVAGIRAEFRKQMAAIKKARAAAAAMGEVDPDLWAAVLFVLSTGGGKTYTFSYIAHNAAMMNNPVIIIVHRKELLLQASSSLRNLGIEHGMISPQFTPNPRAMIQVASIDTLMIRAKKRSFNFGLIIFDEAHHVVLDNKWGVVYEMLGRPPMLGVTATPKRADGKGLGSHAGGLFHAMVEGPPLSELIARGMLINPTVYTSLDAPDLSGLKRGKDGDVGGKALAERTDKPVITGSAVSKYKEVCPGAKAIVFCTNIKHARNVVAEFNNAGYRFALLVGQPEMSDAERTQVNKDLRDGVLDGVCTVDLVSEGYDLPGLECCIMLRPTESESLFLQQVGRVMRTADGKEICWLLDHVGNVGRMMEGEFVRKHGLPNEDRDWSLDGRPKKKGKKAAPEEKVALLQCPKCFLTHEPAPRCPKCGHKYEAKVRKLEEVEGDITLITEEMAATLSKQRRQQQGQCKTLEELKSYGAVTGKNPGWALHVWNSRSRKKEKASPEKLAARVTKMLAVFATHEVSAAMIGTYLGHSLDEATESDINRMQLVYNAIKAGTPASEFFGNPEEKPQF